MDASGKTTVHVRQGDRLYLVSIKGEIDSTPLEIEVAPVPELQNSKLKIEAQAPSLRVGVISRNQGRWILDLDGRVEEVEVSRDGGNLVVTWRNHSFRLQGHSPRDGYLEPFLPEASGQEQVRAQMAGKVVAVLKQQGDSVQAGEGLLIIEAMKMQNELTASRSGTVSICQAREGLVVNAGDLLMEIE
jgi:biotin carboxyl carrier protein